MGDIRLYWMKNRSGKTENDYKALCLAEEWAARSVFRTSVLYQDVLKRGAVPYVARKPVWE